MSLRGKNVERQKSSEMVVAGMDDESLYRRMSGMFVEGSTWSLMSKRGSIKVETG